ncbi:MAG: histidine kinase, partial [Schaalia georgiae]|nr:histidine kinase [Schaalia georgiae]
MPEWKSFTLDGDESAASPGAAEQGAPAAGGPGPDEFALKWGTEVQPVTIERIAAVLEGDGLPVATSEFVAATQVEEGNFQIHREPADCPWAQVELRLLVQGAELADLDSIANDWNAAHLQPTVFPVPEA